MNVVRSYFRNSATVKLQELNKKEKQAQQIDSAVLEKFSQYDYMLDPEVSDYSKFCMYVNQSEGYDYITADELINLLEGDI